MGRKRKRRCKDCYVATVEEEDYDLTGGRCESCYERYVEGEVDNNGI